MADVLLTEPKKPSRALVYLIVLVAVFLIGFVPMWIKARTQSFEREKAEHQLTAVKMVKDLGAATVDARRKEYEAARLEASAFFTAAHFEIDRKDISTLTPSQRDELQPLLGAQDELITLLARGDSAAPDKLVNLFVAVRKVLGT